MGCNKCGMCCLTIPLDKGSYYRVLRGKINAVDGDFIKKLKRISKRKAYKINPFLKVRASKLKVAYFQCPQLDEATHLCKIHNNKPMMCSQYPFYGEPIIYCRDNLIYGSKCGYYLTREEQSHGIA